MEKVRLKSTKIIGGKTITERGFSGWMAINTGTASQANPIVNGVKLAPGERLDFLNAIPSTCEWQTPIVIQSASETLDPSETIVPCEVTLLQLFFTNECEQNECE